MYLCGGVGEEACCVNTFIVVYKTKDCRWDNSTQMLTTKNQKLFCGNMCVCMHSKTVKECQRYTEWKRNQGSIQLLG